jgi:hypothetical protein
VDFVLEDLRGRLVGVEVKKTASPVNADFKGPRHLRQQGERDPRDAEAVEIPNCRPA